MTAKASAIAQSPSVSAAAARFGSARAPACSSGNVPVVVRPVLPATVSTAGAGGLTARSEDIRYRPS